MAKPVPPPFPEQKFDKDFVSQLKDFPSLLMTLFFTIIIWLDSFLQSDRLQIIL